MSKSIKVSPETLLRYAKESNLIIAKGENVKTAKKFSDLTPGKQKIIIESYKKKVKTAGKKFRSSKIIKPDVPENYYTRDDTWDGKDLKMYRLPGNYMFRVDFAGGEYGDNEPGKYAPSFNQELKKHQEIIDWAVKNEVISFRPYDPKQLEERKELEKQVKIPNGEEWQSGMKMNSFIKEGIKDKIKKIDDSIAYQKKQFVTNAGVRNKDQLQSVLNVIKSAVEAKITEANKNMRVLEKKEAGKIASKGLIGGIGVVKKPEKVDTSKGGAGMGKEVNITQGKKFRQEFKGGAKITWLGHVKKFREANPELSYKDALKEAKKTYTPMRKKEREQEKIDRAEKKKSFVKKPRKFTKKQVALRFSAYDEPDYDEDFEKVWNEKIKGKRFKDNDELLKEMKKHYSP